MIRTLPPSIRDRIAAGEVIERPASVVKELVENSLDAGATRVTVEVLDAGRREIRVVDDGCGIPSGDVEKAFERYSTSKICSLEDLARISTLGFRGEALASISAAAGEVEVITRTASEDAGTRVRVKGGRLTERSEIGANVGTIVVVRDLFARIPARKKFMKGRRVEMAHISDTVSREALSHPGVAFKLVRDGVVVFTTSGRGLHEAVSSIYGPSVASSMVPLERSASGVHVSGLISTPPEVRRSGDNLTFVLNSRYVECTWMRRAVMRGLRGMLPEGQFPVGVVMIDVDPASVDVNVHPRKMDVKVTGDTQIAIAVRDAVCDAIRRVKRKEFRRVGGSLAGRASGVAQERKTPGHHPRPGRGGGTAGESRPIPTGDITPPAEAPIHVVGQVFDTFMLVVRGEELLIVDQHVAHERVLYERLTGSEEVTSQRLLVPFVVELSPRDMAVFQMYREAMVSTGFEFEEFGKRSVRVRAVPDVVRGPVSERVVKDILDDLREEGRVRAVEEAVDRVRKVTACRSAIMAGDRIAPEFFRPIFQELLKARDPFRCPHGRPIVISLHRDKLAREFGR